MSVMCIYVCSPQPVFSLSLFLSLPPCLIFFNVFTSLCFLPLSPQPVLFPCACLFLGPMSLGILVCVLVFIVSHWQCHALCSLCSVLFPPVSSPLIHFCCVAHVFPLPLSPLCVFIVSVPLCSLSSRLVSLHHISVDHVPQSRSLCLRVSRVQVLCSAFCV